MPSRRPSCISDRSTVWRLRSHDFGTRGGYVCVYAGWVGFGCEERVLFWSCCKEKCLLKVWPSRKMKSCKGWIFMNH